MNQNQLNNPTKSTFRTTAKLIFNIRFWVFNVKKAVGSLSGSFWFIPSIMIASALCAGYFLPQLEGVKLEKFLADTRLAVVTADSAMQIVQVVATSTITITSIAFSMTIVALVMASNQFGPRLLKNFMENKSTQFVLGIFTGTFVFCLVILNQINTSNESPYYPSLSVLIALILSIVCVFVLIFFIHHVATSIRADTVIKQTAHFLMCDMRVLQQDNERVSKYPSLIKLDQYNNKSQIFSKCDGYIQAIEYQQISNLAKTHNGIIEMRCRAGDYLITGTPVAMLYSEQTLPNDLEVDQSILIGKERTPLQDPLFAINQLVEMALRALSPSMNDPFTANNCIDYLASALASFSPNNLPKNTLVDEEKSVRIITKDVTFDDLFEGAFLQIRQNCSSHPFVTSHLLRTFIILLESSRFAAHMISAVEQQVAAIKESSKSTQMLSNAIDKKAYAKILATLEEYLALEQ